MPCGRHRTAGARADRRRVRRAHADAEGANHQGGARRGIGGRLPRRRHQRRRPAAPRRRWHLGRHGGRRGEERGGHGVARQGRGRRRERRPARPADLHQHAEVRVHDGQRELRQHREHGGGLDLPAVLPLLPRQILLLNFLSDLPSITLAGDRVDPEDVQRPRRWRPAPGARLLLVVLDARRRLRPADLLVALQVNAGAGAVRCSAPAGSSGRPSPSWPCCSCCAPADPCGAARRAMPWCSPRCSSATSHPRCRSSRSASRTGPGPPAGRPGRHPRGHHRVLHRGRQLTKRAFFGPEVQATSQRAAPSRSGWMKS